VGVARGSKADGVRARDRHAGGPGARRRAPRIRRGAVARLLKLQVLTLLDLSLTSGSAAGSLGAPLMYRRRQCLCLGIALLPLVAACGPSTRTKAVKVTPTHTAVPS